MSKLQRSNREVKKQPLLSPKEKKAARLARKNAASALPLIIPKA